MSKEDTALQLVLIAWLSARLTELDRSTRDGVDWPAKTRAVAALPDGTTVGTVTMTHGAASAKVVDEQAFTAWVQDNYPTEIVEQVRPAFKRSVLDRVKRDGELPPGVDLTYGDPRPMVKTEPGAETPIMRAWQSGHLDLCVVSELEPLTSNGDAL